jgi:DNA polymerase-1
VPDDAPRRLFLLDGHSLAYRAFFALPPTLATSSGTVTNAVYGFTSMLIKLLGDEHPDLIAVAFDAGAPTVRLEKDPEYKAGRRETPADFSPQLGLIDEVLAALRIRVIRVEGHEADDALGTLATRAAEAGLDATIVTADRDFFQLIRDRTDDRGAVSVLYNRRGISEIDRMDEAAVQTRFGVPPSAYLEYVALKGDTSDNIPGVPGVGEKTAAKLVQTYGTVEELVARADAELKGKQREHILAAADRLALNKELAAIVTDVELPVEVEDCVMGTYDPDEVRRLFISLEFRSLLDRLAEAMAAGEAPVETIDLQLERAGMLDLPDLLKERPVTLVPRIDDGLLIGVAVSAGEARATYIQVDDPAAAAVVVADGADGAWTHDAKTFERALRRSGDVAPTFAFDTLLAGYLLDPGAPDYGLRSLAERYLGADVLGPPEDDAGQLFADDPWTQTAEEAAAVALVAPPMRETIDERGLGSLLADVELPLSHVLAGMEAAGIALDAPYLEAMAADVRERMRTLRDEVFGYAGREFNLNSPPQLREILYGELGLQPGKKTPKGELSTDASVLEKLRDEHPIVDGILSWRELDKLNSTYLEALPKLVDPSDGRVHTTFNQAAAATGRLSSTNPNLQNVPVRSELGRQIRRAFVPGEAGQVLLVADYSQIELRVLAHLSGDEGLRAAFAAGDDIHAATAAAVFGLPIDQVDGELRRRAKAVNYGLAYGMNAWGLAQRLDIAPDEAQEIMDGYFAGFPKIKEYLAAQVERARLDGYTETLLGRRRYIPELTSDNRRIRELGERQALNAPIQGGASDIFKVAMIGVDRALADAPDLGCTMLLTVHDELVFEVPETSVEDAAQVVRDAMEHAIDLDVPLVASIAWGPNWADAAPEGH